MESTLNSSSSSSSRSICFIYIVRGAFKLEAGSQFLRAGLRGCRGRVRDVGRVALAVTRLLSGGGILHGTSSTSTFSHSSSRSGAILAHDRAPNGTTLPPFVMENSSLRQPRGQMSDEPPRPNSAGPFSPTHPNQNPKCAKRCFAHKALR